MRIIIHILLLCHFFFLASSQNQILDPIWNKQGVDHLSIDSSNSLLIFSSEGNRYVYNGESAKPWSGPLATDNVDDSIAIDANTILYKNQKLILPSTVHDVTIDGDSALFIATDLGLYYSEIPIDIIAKEVLSTELTSLGMISNVRSAGGLLLISNESQICIWNREQGQYDFIPHDGIHINDAALDDFGNLWIASSKGIYAYAIYPERKQKVPTLSIEWDQEKEENIPGNLVIAKGYKEEFKVEGHHLLQSENVELFAELSTDGVSEKINIEDKRFSLVGLDQGKHKLRFATKLRGEPEAHFSDWIDIKVTEPQFNYWWLIFGSIGLLLLMSLISTFRNKQFNKDLISQRDRLILENKALKSEQQALRLQMNPHFIFNVLNSINGMIAIGDTKNARAHVNKFSQLMRSVLKQSRNEHISLEDEVKYLTDYLSLEKITHNDSFDFKITVDKDLDLESKCLPMIIQPFVENAIVHGFQNLERPGLLEINIDQKKDFIEVSIKDNGKGREAAAATKKKEHESIGLQVVKERLKAPYGYKITDLKMEGKATGTHVDIKMPIY